MWLDLVPRLSFGTTTYSVGTQAEPGFETKVEMMPIRDGHADIFGDADIRIIRHMSDIAQYCRIVRKLVRVSIPNPSAYNSAPNCL